MLHNLFKMNLFGLLLLGNWAFAQLSASPDHNMVIKVLNNSSTERSLSKEDLSYELTDFHTSKISGVQHIYMRQVYNGLEIIGTETSIHLNSLGEVSSVKNKFVNSLEKRAKSTAINPQIDALQAVNSAAAHLGYNITKGISVVSQDFTTDRKTIISNGGISLSNIPARLLYFLNDKGELELVWELSIEAIDRTEWYNLRVDAVSGKVIDKVNWVYSCGFDHSHDDENTELFHKDRKVNIHSSSINSALLKGVYNVFAMPLESPYEGDRTMVLEDDVVNLNASPYGWHDTDGIEGAEYTTTRGNNVNAYEDGDNQGFQPDGGLDLVFDFPFDPNYSTANQSESAAITNLFYWNNIVHDVFYEYGFDEVSGNFQQNNYGKGGLGNDFVLAEAQDGSGSCNANFTVPPDGTSGTMQMFICNSRDGDFDNGVIVHEYGHGITVRLTGGPSNSDCLFNGENLGEGWSDWFGLMLTLKEGDLGTDLRTIGPYLMGQEPDGPGIRPHPYSTDMNVNPHTYDDIKSAAFPHGVGSVWAAMLWDLTWVLIDEYGFDPDVYNGTGGNNIALAIVVEALKLQPCSPGFVDGRDAILEADQLLYGGVNQCFIWDVFARRGLGLSADQGSSQSQTDGVEAFDSPNDSAQFSIETDLEFCIQMSPATDLGGGIPAGGVYSGPGVIDHGNGRTYTFDPQVAGTGSHTVTYTLAETACQPERSASVLVEVTEGIELACPSNIEVSSSDDSCSAVVSYATPVGTSTCQLSNAENFDNADAPVLPEGWTTTNDTGTENNWVVVNNQSMSSPNSAFVVNLGSVSISSLVSPSILIGDSEATLKFNIFHNTELNFDGVVLEYSTDNGGSWNDILSGGGTFVSGAYNSTLGTGWENPLPARQAWSGNSIEFIPVEISLNSSLSGQSVKFRWRMGSDRSSGRPGVWLDDIRVLDADTPAPVTTQIAGLPSGSQFPVGVTTNTFEIEDAAGFSTTCSFDVIVTDEAAPEISCPENFTIGVGNEGSYTLPDFWEQEEVTATDNCTISNHSQNPTAGTVLPLGVHTIEFSVEDAAGNISTCSFELTIDDSMGTSDGQLSGIEIFPNPVNDILNIKYDKEISSVSIYDASGRCVYNMNNLNSKHTQINISHLYAGVYMVQVHVNSEMKTFKIVKR